MKLDIIGIWEWGIYGLMGWAFMPYNGWSIYGLMGRAFRVWLWLKWVGQLWQSKLLFYLEICSKNAGLQGSTLSDHRMTTGFRPFELPTCGLLQRGRDHSSPKACFYLRSPALGWLSQYYEYTVVKRNGGGAEWVELNGGAIYNAN